MCFGEANCALTFDVERFRHACARGARYDAAINLHIPRAR